VNRTRLIITGFSGFVAFHYLELLERKNVSIEVLGLDLNPPEFDLNKFKNITIQFEKINLLNKEGLVETLKNFKPTEILHLASFSSVAYSWKHPEDSFLNNTNIFLNLINAVRVECPDCTVLSVGSSEQYGKISEANLPLDELSATNPISPYAVARASQEMLGKIYVEGYGLKIIFTRSFNHFGPYQKENFVVSSFARKVINEMGAEDPKVITTGDLSIVRDFVDVRDVVEAYYGLFQKGKIGEIYNICSGQGTPLMKIINEFILLSGKKLDHEVDSSFIRPNDNPVIVGDNSKIKELLNWQPKIELNESLNDIFNFWKKNEGTL
jgi:GDP-4-dehydro-6-deoxy-D-mannose reductase